MLHEIELPGVIVNEVDWVIVCGHVGVGCGDAVPVAVAVAVAVAVGLGVGDPLGKIVIGLLVPVMDEFIVSVAVIVWTPGEPSMTLNVAVPLANILSGGK